MYERLLSVAKEKGTSIWQVLDALHISRGVMSALRSGKSKSLSLKNLQKIADYLGVSVNYIINGQNDIVNPQNDKIDDFAFALYNETKRLTDEQKQIILDLVKKMNAKE